jgi:hypothetical protein
VSGAPLGWAPRRDSGPLCWPAGLLLFDWGPYWGAACWLGAGAAATARRQAASSKGPAKTKPATPVVGGWRNSIITAVKVKGCVSKKKDVDQNGAAAAASDGGEADISASLPLMYGRAWLLALGEMPVGGSSSVLTTTAPAIHDGPQPYVRHWSLGSQ